MIQRFLFSSFSFMGLAIFCLSLIFRTGSFGAPLLFLTGAK